MASNDVACTSLIRLRRFLYLGTEQNVWKLEKIKFNRESVQSIQCLIDESKGSDVIAEILSAYKAERSVYPDAIIFALTICCHSKDEQTRKAAISAASEICKDPASLFAFISYNEKLSTPGTGWGRGCRRLVFDWYIKRDAAQLAVDVTKVRSRCQWSHKDVLCLSHVKPVKKDTAAVFKFVMHGIETAEKEYGSEPEALTVLTYLKAVHELKHTTDYSTAARLVEIHNLCYEHIPTALLKSKEIWLSLIPRLELNVLLKVLPRLSRLGLLKLNSPHLKLLLERLREENIVEESNIGPLDTFLALRRWEASHQLLGTRIIRHSVPQLNEALLNLHMESFKNVPSTGKRYLLAIDVRGTMVHTHTAGCSSISPADACAIVLMALLKAEVSNVTAIAFSTDEMVNVDVNNKMTLADIGQRLRNIPIGPVNLASPIKWALEKKRPFDLIAVFTDNQTRPVDIHPFETLTEYRKTMNLPETKYVLCALTSKGTVLAPHAGYGMLDIIGFNVKLLQVIQDFSQGLF